jgi:hypothetical protein
MKVYGRKSSARLARTFTTVSREVFFRNFWILSSRLSVLKSLAGFCSLRERGGETSPVLPHDGVDAAQLHRFGFPLL